MSDNPAPAPTRTVLIATPYLPPEGGGLERYARTIAALLVSDFGWRVVLVTSGPRGSSESVADEDGVRIYRVPTQVTLSRTPISLSWPRRLRKIARQENAVLVNAHAPVPGMGDAASMADADIPFVLTYHAGPMQKGRPYQDRMIWLYEHTLLRYMAGRADEVICNSRYVQEAFAREFAGKSVVIPPGVDASAFTPGNGGRPGAIVFVSQMEAGMEFKGLDVLMHAMVRLAHRGVNPSLEVVGTGSLMPGYRHLAADLGLGPDRVRFSGYLAGHDLVEAYQRSSVAALPSGNESFGMSLAEAMACGLPVVASRTGGIPDVVAEGETGLLVTHGAVDELADALARIIGDPILADRFGRAGRCRAELEFDWGVRARATHEVFERVLDSERVRSTVAIVTPRYPPDVGGVERYSSQIAEGLSDSDQLDPLVISTRRGAASRYSYHNGVPVVRLGTWVKLWNTPLSPLWPWQIRRLLRGRQAAVVNIHSPVAGLADAAAMVAGDRPLALTYHAGSMLKGSTFVDIIIGSYERLVLPRLARKADSVAVVSPATQLSDHAGALLVPPAVDLTAFRFVEMASPSPLRLLFVGRIDGSATWKGERVLFEALAKAAESIPDIELEIVGGGDGHDSWVAAVEDQGVADRVRFSGVLGGAALQAAYHRASILVLPSITAAESFGMCLIEAMACGRPVIGSRIGGIPFVVSHDSDGLLVPPGDATALASAIVELGRDPERRATMGRNGRRKAESRFSITGLQSSYEKLFKELLA